MAAVSLLTEGLKDKHGSSSSVITAQIVTQEARLRGIAQVSNSLHGEKVSCSKNEFFSIIDHAWRKKVGGGESLMNQTFEKQTLLMSAKSSHFAGVSSRRLVQIPRAGPEKLYFLLLTEHAPG